MTKNGVEFLIGWRDFPLDKDDTWEPITNLPGSEHMIVKVTRLSIRQDLQDRWVTNLNEERKGFFQSRTPQYQTGPAGLAVWFCHSSTRA